MTGSGPGVATAGGRLALSAYALVVTVLLVLAVTRGGPRAALPTLEAVTGERAAIEAGLVGLPAGERGAFAAALDRATAQPDAAEGVYRAPLLFLAARWEDRAIDREEAATFVDLVQLADRMREVVHELASDVEDLGPTGDVLSDLEARRFPDRLPEFTLPDPLGKRHRSRDLHEPGLLLVVTAPTLGQGGVQERWDRLLKGSFPEERSPRLVFLEDMEPSWFPETALARMKEEFAPDQPPLLLVDQDGAVRRKLGVEEERTVVLAFDREGKRVRAEEGEPTLTRARRLVGAVSSR